MYPITKIIHIKIDNNVALSYFMKIGGTQNQLSVQISKEILEYLLEKEISITPRIFPRSPQQKARHALTNLEGFKRVEIKSSGVSKPLQILVDPKR